jgi:hypothetical protein
VEHHRPAGWEQFVERLRAIPYVTSFRYDPQALGSGVKVIDAANGIIGVCYGGPQNALPLRVETTARGEEQTQLVADCLRRLK